jgi:hypothetical protein
MEKILITIVVLLVLRFVHLLLAKMGYEASVEVVFSNVKKTKKDLLAFLEKNKDTFYSQNNWESILEVKGKIKELKAHEDQYKNDSIYIESLVDLNSLNAEYEKKLFGLISAKYRKNEELVKHLNALMSATILLSKEVSNKPLDSRLKKLYKRNYEMAVALVKNTSSFLRTLNFRSEAEHLEFWGAV